MVNRESVLKEDVRTFEDLEAWRACRELRAFVTREIIPRLPKSEQFELVNQIKRAARSTTNNIAEGYGRFHFRDNYRFCSNARGSLYEVLDHLLDANDEGFIDDDLTEEGRALFNRAVQLLSGYMNDLNRAAADNRIREDDTIRYRTSEERLTGTG